jgi:DNA topoisomerase-1
MTTIERLHDNGILRLGSPKAGFQYKHADGRKVNSEDLERIRRLKIPPAWQDVAINSATSGRVQAVGLDAAGRWQYLYHEKHIQSQNRRKFNRLIEFGDALPIMRQTVSRHLRQADLSQECVISCLVRILSISYMRPGSEVYATENGSYGITTLRPRHVTAKGDLIAFDFPGKSNVRQRREIRDRSVARTVRRLLKHPNARVFRFQAADGKLAPVTGKLINSYIKQVMGRRFSAKDFRTWAGTLVCACVLAQEHHQTNAGPTNAERKIKAAIKVTAEVLGNTPAVCRRAYVCPELLTSFNRGHVIRCNSRSLMTAFAYRGPRLHPAERALLRLLKKS